MRALICALSAVLCLSGCKTVPNVPATVTVVVERYKPLPAWAIEPLEKPMPANSQVQSHLITGNARGEIIDFANCRSLLLIKLDKGEPVDRKDCEVQR